MAGKAVLRLEGISDFTTKVYQGDLTAKGLLSLANRTLGVLTSASLAGNFLPGIGVSGQRRPLF